MAGYASDSPRGSSFAVPGLFGRGETGRGTGALPSSKPSFGRNRSEMAVFIFSRASSVLRPRTTVSGNSGHPATYSSPSRVRVTLKCLFMTAAGCITYQHSTAGRAPSRIGITRTVSPGRSVAVRGYFARRLAAEVPTFGRKCLSESSTNSSSLNAAFTLAYCSRS
jgi:hypothetical protein